MASQGRDKAVIDYGYHANLVEWNDAIIDEIPSLLDEGVSSIKALMAYKGRLQIDDTGLFRTLQKARDYGILTMVHCENGDAIDVLIQQARDNGQLQPKYHAKTRPAWLETEATLRSIALAAVADAPLYVVHMTCEGSVDQLRYGRAHDLKVMGETCVQYLFFTEDDLARPDGAKWVCSPPIRTQARQRSACGAPCKWATCKPSPPITARSCWMAPSRSSMRACRIKSPAKNWAATISLRCPTACPASAIA